MWSSQPADMVSHRRYTASYQLLEWHSKPKPQGLLSPPISAQSQLEWEDQSGAEPEPDLKSLSAIARNPPPTAPHHPPPNPTPPPRPPPPPPPQKKTPPPPRPPPPPPPPPQKTPPPTLQTYKQTHPRPIVPLWGLLWGLLALRPSIHLHCVMVGCCFSNAAICCAALNRSRCSIAPAKSGVK